MVQVKNISGGQISIAGIGNFRAGDVVQLNPGTMGAKDKMIIGRALQNLPDGNTLVEIDPIMVDDVTPYDRLDEPQVLRVIGYLKEKESIGLLEKVDRSFTPINAYVCLNVYGIRLKIWYEVIAQEVKRLANVAASSIYWEDEESPNAVCRVHIYIGVER